MSKVKNDLNDEECYLIKKHIKDIKMLTNLSNEYLDKFIKLVDPREYSEEEDKFLEMCLTGPSMICASIIDKLEIVLQIEREVVKEKFIKKLDLALRWVDHKENR